MKLNKIKLVVGALAVASVASMVGSISGTVAWFQYSTRVTAAYEGAAAHCSENLQIRLYKDADHKSDWKQDLETSDIATYLSGVRTNANKLAPVTSGELAADSVPAKLYKNPIYQYAATASWGEAGAEDYIDLPLQFRVLDVNGNTTTESYLAKKIYLSDITLAAKVAAKDMSSALRVVVDNKDDFTQTFSSTGAAVNVGGQLDLNADGVIDQTEGYEWTARTNVKYGDYDGVTPKTAASQAVGTKATGASDLKVANDADPYDIKGKPLLTSTAASDTPANIAAKADWAGITIRIYLEGWTALDSGTFGKTGDATPTLVWDALKVIGDSDVVFRAGLRFSAEAHTAH